MVICHNTAFNMLVISSNFKINSAYCVTKFIARKIFGTKIFLLLPTISSWSSFLAAVPRMSSFWLCLDKFYREDIPSEEFLFSFFYPILPALFFQNLDNQGLRWDGGFLLLAPHPQNEMNKSSILALVSITLVDWSCSDQMGLC